MFHHGARSVARHHAQGVGQVVGVGRGEADGFARAGVVETEFDRVQVDRKTLRLYRNGAAQIVPTVMNRLSARNLDPIALTLTTPTLDDVFLALTGRTLREAGEGADADQDDQSEKLEEKAGVSR